MQSISQRPIQTGRAPGARPTKNSVTSEVAGAIIRSLNSGAVGADSFPGNARLIAKLAEYNRLEDRFVQPFAALGDGLEYVCRAYLGVGDEALIAGPADSMFRPCAERCGALIRLSLASTPFMSDISGLIQGVTPKTRLIYLMSPNYPTGTVYTHDDIERLLVSAPRALLIVDEAYFEFYGETCSQLIRRYDNLIVLRRLSEAVGMTVFPCDYVLASPTILDCVNAARVNQNIPAPIQAGAIAALDHARLSTEYVRQVKENRTYLALRLQQFGIETKITPTDVVLMKVAWPEKVVSFLKEWKITATDSSSMPQMGNYAHITVGDNEYCANVITCFAEMPESYYLLASIASSTLTLAENENVTPAVGLSALTSARPVAQRLVFNRSAKTVSETVFADVAGRLSRSGSSTGQRIASEFMNRTNRTEAVKTTITKGHV